MNAPARFPACATIHDFEPGLRPIGEALARASIPQLAEIMRIVPARCGEPGAFICQGCDATGVEGFHASRRRKTACANCDGAGYLRRLPA